ERPREPRRRSRGATADAAPPPALPRGQDRAREPRSRRANRDARQRPHRARLRRGCPRHPARRGRGPCDRPLPSRRPDRRAHELREQDAVARDGPLAGGGVMTGMLDLELTRRCNLRCEYCFVGWSRDWTSDLPRESALAIVEEGAGAFTTLHLTG